jgi:hypothetical protein
MIVEMKFQRQSYKSNQRKPKTKFIGKQPLYRSAITSLLLYTQVKSAYPVDETASTGFAAYFFMTKSAEFFCIDCFRDERRSGKFGLCFFAMKSVQNFCDARFHDEKSSKKFNLSIFMSKNDEKFLHSLFS